MTELTVAACDDVHAMAFTNGRAKARLALNGPRLGQCLEFCAKRVLPAVGDVQEAILVFVRLVH